MAACTSRPRRASAHRRARAETSRDRVLTDDEIVAVWRGCEEIDYPYGTVVRILLLTGARREEIARLQWSEVDSDTIRLTGGRTKNGQPHDIPLSSSARAIIERVPRLADCPFLFSPSGRAPVTGWLSAKARLDKTVSISSMAHSRPAPHGCHWIGEAWCGVAGGRSRIGSFRLTQRHRWNLSAPHLRCRKTRRARGLGRLRRGAGRRPEARQGAAD